MTTPSPAARHLRAVLMLVVANAFWGLSFPLNKAIAFEHLHVLPGSGSWFITACLVAPRFLLAAVILGLGLRGALGGMTRREVRQGVILALFNVLGMFFQIDGLQYTLASTSAFLTQVYAIMIPLWLALRLRRLPPAIVWVCCALVLAGVAILGRFDWGELRLGRGEVETLISALFFMGQILALDRADFAANRPLPVTFVLFAVEAVAAVAMVGVTAPRWSDVPRLLTSVPWVGFSLALTLFCTVGAFTLMNIYQPRITATEAGLVYCLESVFGSCLALFLPGLFSRWAGFDYPDETLTLNLIVGGGLITAANILIQLKPPPKTAPP